MDLLVALVPVGAAAAVLATAVEAYYAAAGGHCGQEFGFVSFRKHRFEM